MNARFLAFLTLLLALAAPAVASRRRQHCSTRSGSKGSSGSRITSAPPAMPPSSAIQPA